MTTETPRPPLPYHARLGAGPSQIDTPALLLDHDKLERNIAAMAAFVAGGPAKLRPHSKTHKCVEIARLQLAAGAVGITCAKVGEAEALADGGIPDILIANQVVGPIKIARLVALARRCAVTVAVDDAGNVAAALAPPRRAGVVIRCYVEVDVGMARCGVPDGAAALEPRAPGRTQRRAWSSPACRPTRATCRSVVPLAERLARARHDMAAARAAREAVEAGGLPVGQVSGGGTGTHMVTGRLPFMTELQCGSYATMDAQYKAVGGADFENALTVLATVMSRPRPERAVIDAGLKAITPEFGEPTRARRRRELARLLRGARRARPERRRRAGCASATRSSSIPRHGCTTINLYDQIHVMREGRLIDERAVAGRGRSQ